MTTTIINEGDKNKQGNAVCPQCGRKVLLDSAWGDPPKCPKCDVPYQRRIIYIGFRR